MNIEVHNLSSSEAPVFMSISGKDASRFQLSGEPFDTIPGDGFKIKQISFSPDSPGFYTGSFDVYLSGSEVPESAALDGFGEIQSELTITPPEQIVSGTGGSVVFDIKSNVSWFVSYDSDWLTVAPDSGTNDGTLTVSYSDNPGPVNRTASIFVTGGDITRSVNLIQEPALFLTIDPPEVFVPASSGNTTFNISSNVDWEASSDQEWLTILPANGSNSQTLSVSYSQNADTSSRTATITVYAGEQLYTQASITQAGGFILDIDPQSRYVSNNAGNTTFNITSNGTWSITDDADWLNIEPQTGSNNQTIIVSYSANTDTNGRVGTITVTGGGISKNVSVIQVAPNILEVSPDNILVSSDSGSTIFKINSNTSWIASDKVDWLDVKPRIGKNSGNLTVFYSQNKTNYSREGIISIGGGGIIREVKVIQSSSDFLEINPQERQVTESPGTITFSISSNITWTITEDADWLSVTPQTGENNQIITVSYSENTSSSARTATIIISGNGITRSFTINQSGLSFLVIEPVNRSVTNSAGSTTFNISSNTSWSVLDNADWLSVTPDTGSNGAILTASFTQNNGMLRTATITVNGGGLTRSVTVTQSDLPSLEVEPLNRLVTSSAGNTTFNISSNVSWNITDDADWLNVTPQNGKNNQVITASFSENTSSAARVATITVEGNGITKIITVNQSAQMFLILEPENRSVGNESGETTFNILSNISWAVRDNADWLSVSPDTGSNNGILTASFAQNRDSIRTATITVIGGGLTKSVTVTQSDLPFLEVEPLNRSVTSSAGSTTFNISSNVQWNVTDDADWLSVLPESGSNNQTLTVSYIQNSGNTSRTGTITISSSRITKSVIINQSALTFLEVNPVSHSVSDHAGNITFDIMSNINWVVTNDSGWLTVNPDTGSNNGTINVFYSENTTPAFRTGTITIDGGGLVRNVTIIQSFVPVITATAPDSVNLGEPSNVMITSPENFSFTSRLFYYKQGGKRDFNRIDISSMTGNIFTIPADSVTERGIQYYVLFSNGTDSVSFPANQPSIHPASIRTYVKEMVYGKNSNLSFQPEYYKMISIPMELQKSDIKSVLEENYGSYNRLMWRFYLWDPAKKEYIEYEDISSGFKPGNSFFLITREGKTFTVKNAKSVKLDSSYTLTIYPGYNQIANPFAFPVSWDNIEKSELVEKPVMLNSDNSGWLSQNILKPWEGYFVYSRSSEPEELKISPIEIPSGIPQKKLDNLIGNEFVIQIKSTLESTEFQDQFNYVGMRIGALNNDDKFDLHKPPSISDNLTLKILSDGGEYAENYLPPSDDGVYWNFKINTEYSEINVSLEFIEVAAIPLNFKIWLIDLDRMLSIPLIKNHAILNMNKKNEKSLKLIIGTDEYARNVSGGISLIPAEYQLFQNFPNPFNPQTNIYYTLKEKSIVTLEIFDILGRKVQTLFSNELQEEGIKNITWNSRNQSGDQVASGIYIYRLRANEFTSSKKMLFLK